MAFDPQDYDVKPIGAAGLTERTSLDGSERILVQAGADADVDTTPMQFFRWQIVKNKIDEIKGTGWAGQTVKGNADAVDTLADAVDTLKGTGWAGQTVKGNTDAVDTLKGTGWAGQTVKGNADAVDTLKGTGWAGQTVKGNADAIALRELLSNKKTTLADNSDTYFPTQKAVNDGLATKASTTHNHDDRYYTESEILNKTYPIGSIYLSVVATNPGTLFGGTWEQLQNRFLLGAGSSYANGAIGGEATHILSEAEMPSHTHAVVADNGTTLAGGGFTSWPDSTSWCFTDVPDGANANGSSGKFNAAPKGGGAAHNNMPPYLAVYMWKRTA